MPFDRPVAARRDGATVAGAEDREIAALRHEGSRSPRRSSTRRRLSASGGPWRTANTPALGRRCFEHGGAVADGEDPLVAGRAQRVVDGDEPAFVERQAGRGEPWRGTRLGDDEHRVGLLPFAILELHRAAFDALGRRPSRAAAGRGAGRSCAACARGDSAWPARISSLVASVTCSWAPFATSRSRWSIASASSTPPAPPPITTTLSGPSQVVMRSQEGRASAGRDRRSA